ncbi:galactose-3-O-sulfotransferase 4 [Rhineura floridana]|uniref:galactose-3-O-sulfotransferase 4 n=1 Tax=Rhineura floridana TaxID=261503 RepID=UPI002AC88725|nr:galactose-3-O-sulfotransferase 4 [Rhineura floridana]XP_061445433.1 galactose-3-O-sulfotransferase 4 [Rhineura floridana]
MRVLYGGCCRFQVLWAALAISITIGFTIQFLGVSVQKRVTLSPLPRTTRAPPAKAEKNEGEQGPPSQPLPCQPRQHLVFLKSHKTGSSTITNILHRFGDAQSLRFALPARYQFSYPNLFQARRVKGWHPRGHPFDILCHHMRFNLPEVQKVMHPDSFYFSIVRDPVFLAESAFSYFRGVVPAFRRAGSLPEFLASPQRFYRPGERGNHYARNLLWFDFGLDPPVAPGLAPIKAALAGLERIFHLVLLTEHMDESLILLRHALCWSLEDVAAFQHNLRSPKAVRTLAPADVTRLRAWNNLDWHLYVHFNRTFWVQVEHFGRARLAEEVALLRKQRAELMHHCLLGGGPLEPGQITDERIRPFQFGQVPILGYALQPSLGPAAQELCQRMVTPELQYKDLLDAKHFPPPLQAHGSQAGGVG